MRGNNFIILHLSSNALFGDIPPLEDIGKVNAPIFFIHGGEDKYMPAEMGRQLHAAHGGKKRLYICPGAGHSESFWANRAEYEKQVREFLTETGMK